jgi:hypothetical protein
VTKVGPKEAQRRKLRERERDADGINRRYALGLPESAWNKARKIDGDGTLKPASEPKRMGRPPRLSRGDYAAVEAASRDLLAVALRYYNKHAARNLKQKA